MNRVCPPLHPVHLLQDSSSLSKSSVGQGSGGYPIADAKPFLDTPMSVHMNSSMTEMELDPDPSHGMGPIVTTTTTTTIIETSRVPIAQAVPLNEVLTGAPEDSKSTPNSTSVPEKLELSKLHDPTDGPTDGLEERVIGCCHGYDAADGLDFLAAFVNLPVHSLAESMPIFELCTGDAKEGEAEVPVLPPIVVPEVEEECWTTEIKASAGRLPKRLQGDKLPEASLKMVADHKAYNRWFRGAGAVLLVISAAAMGMFLYNIEDSLGNSTILTVAHLAQCQENCALVACIQYVVLPMWPSSTVTTISTELAP